MPDRTVLQGGSTKSVAAIRLRPVFNVYNNKKRQNSVFRSSDPPLRTRNNYEDEVEPEVGPCGRDPQGDRVKDPNSSRSSNWEQETSFNLIEDPRASEFSYRKYILIQKMLLLMTIFSFLISLISSEMHTIEFTTALPDDSVYSRQIDGVNSLVTLLLICCLLMRYVCMNELRIDQKKIYCVRKKRHLFAQITRFFRQRKDVLHFLIELMLVTPHPFYLLESETIKLYQSYDRLFLTHRVTDILTLITLLRTYIIVRCMINLTIYSTPRASRLCGHNRVHHNILFSVKCLLREEPLRIISLVFLVLMVTLGYGLKIAQGSLIYNNPSLPATGFENYINCFWCVFITMATVGYGDYFPRTLPGRIIILTTAISGIILSSLLIVSLSAYLTMQASELKAHITLERLEHQKELKNEATDALIETMNMTRYLASQQKTPDGKIKELFTRIKNKIDSVKFRSRKIKSLINNNNIVEEMDRLFEIFTDSLKECFQNQIMLKQQIESVGQQMKQSKKIGTVFLTRDFEKIITNNKF